MGFMSNLRQTIQEGNKKRMLAKDSDYVNKSIKMKEHRKRLEHSRKKRDLFECEKAKLDEEKSKHSSGSKMNDFFTNKPSEFGKRKKF
jgi:hypothetical protein